MKDDAAWVKVEPNESVIEVKLITLPPELIKKLTTTTSPPLTIFGKEIDKVLQPELEL
jgi:hypothetical protein